MRFVGLVDEQARETSVSDAERSCGVADAERKAASNETAKAGNADVVVSEWIVRRGQWWNRVYNTIECTNDPQVPSQSSPRLSLLALPLPIPRRSRPQPANPTTRAPPLPVRTTFLGSAALGHATTSNFSRDPRYQSVVNESVYSRILRSWTGGSSTHREPRTENCPT